jgi:Ca2+-binding RTX toxin-like protein
VKSSIAWTLATNVENLTLTGTSAINATGNTLANVLTGNSAANTLTGNAGADTLDGKAGADILVGGTGNDTYWLGRGYGLDSITENDTTAGNTDVARFDATVATDQLWFRKVSNNLEVSIIGTRRQADHDQLVPGQPVPRGAVQNQQWQDAARQPGAKPGERHGGLCATGGRADHAARQLCQQFEHGDCGQLAVGQ